MALEVCRTDENARGAVRVYGLEGGFADAFPVAQRYPARVALFEQGDAPEGVFLLEEGLVKLMRLEPDGHETILGLRATGWFVGAAAVILGRPYAVSARTLVPSRVAWLNAAGFLTRAREDPALSWRLHVMHSEEVFAGLSHVADLHACSARSRLEKFLRGLATALRAPDHGAELRLTIPLRQWEIAQLIGVTAPYLSELTRDMEQAGLLRRDRDGLVLSGDWEAMR